MSESPTTVTAADPAAKRSVRDLVRAAISGWLGTALEFMDYQLYSLAAALVFAELFFSAENPAVAVVAAMATYGVGYVARPVGAFFFARLGDKTGRARVLFYTILLMGLATTLIGVLPTYSQVGMLAPILLVLLRIAQGFGAGAEISGAGVMLAEYAPAKRRGIIASLVALGTNCGTLLASGIWAILLIAYSEEEVIEWAWRIPFLASAVIMLFALWVRFNLKETPVFEERDDVVDGRALSKADALQLATETGDVRTLEAMQRKPIKAFIIALMLRFGQAGNSGMIQTYLISYITVVLLLDRSIGVNAVIVSSLVAFITVPLSGWLGDRFGRKRMYIIWAIVALIVIVPTMLMISSQDTTQVFVGYVILHNLAVMSFASLENLTIPEIFGARNRYTYTAMAREIGAIVATGIGPVIAAAWVSAVTGSFIPIIIMLVFFTLSTLIAAIWMPEVAGRDLTDPRDAI
ncbi:MULTISPECIES: MFS transporter [unclassified Microbacterium]|uniref:MFS transporter n=1 Tax=unclassified Microbacterium TaxID=2609290 RepID=UPI00214C29E3|nr:MULTISPECIES: MFS transporter [unclassified Microbacterium]MCR2784122.1 MFS transporter [Microbacterium sp. zg.B96]WIM15041.1 MFS transporter [Microbacterium sp. zg-B96]